MRIPTRGLLASGVLSLLVFVPVSLTRYVDADEGFYLLAGRLITDGDLPYRDFFFPQSPGVPYFFGGWMALTAHTWFAARLAGALLATGVGLLIHTLVRRRTGSTPAAVAATAIYTTSVLAAAWLPLSKTYGATALLLLAACALLDKAQPSRAALVAGGVMVGLATTVRLPVIVALPVLVIFTPGARGLVRRTALIGLGAVAALTPMLLVAAQDPAAAVYGNIGYHAQRSGEGLIGGFEQKADVLLDLLGVAESDVPGGLQFTILLAATSVATLMARRRGRRIPLTTPVAAVVGFVMLTPTPTFEQYFAVVVPLLIVSSADLLEPMCGLLRRRYRWILLPAAAAWVIPIPAALSEYITDVPLDHLRLASIREASHWIDGHTQSGERVLASWPGYLLETDARPIPGLENHFGPPGADALSGSEGRRYDLITSADIRHAARRMTTRLLVRGLWADPLTPDDLGQYRVVASPGGAQILRAQSALSRTYGVPLNR